MIRYDPKTVPRSAEIACDRCGRVIPESECAEQNEAPRFCFTNGFACHFGLFIPAPDA